MEASRRALIADEEARQIRVVESTPRHQAPEMWRQRGALLIMLFLMRIVLRVSTA